MDIVTKNLAYPLGMNIKIFEWEALGARVAE
jgi:hypothetical protein